MLMPFKFLVVVDFLGVTQYMAMFNVVFFLLNSSITLRSVETQSLIFSRYFRSSY
jgi:hypothetical protein